MNTLLSLLVLLSGGLVAYSYVGFPLLLRWLSRGKALPKPTFAPDALGLPAVDILLAAHNEQEVIEQKIRSTFATTYPLEKVRLLVGSDNSSDQTSALLNKLAAEFPQLHATIFAERQGKPGVMQHLSAQATAPVLVLTDANVFFEPDTLYELVKHFASPRVGLVGAGVLAPAPTGPSAGVTAQESAYLARENRFKYQESLIWGAAIGAHGGAFAVRRTAYTPAPVGFVVDDFFISMAALRAGYQVLLNPAARATEDVGDHAAEEFRRKARISVGNFQNVQEFKVLLWPPWRGVAFAFWSHKVLRWLAPHLLLLSLGANTVLVALGGGWFWQVALAGQLGLPLLGALGGLLRRAGGPSGAGLRFVGHFYYMNLALLVGWWRYVRGQRSAVWQPTARNQVARTL